MSRLSLRVRGWGKWRRETVPGLTFTREPSRQRAWMLFRSLEKVAERDPEQEVRGMAVPVLVACLDASKQQVPDHLQAIRAVLSPEAIADGEPVRASDAALVAGQLAAALGPEHVMSVGSCRGLHYR